MIVNVNVMYLFLWTQAEQGRVNEWDGGERQTVNAKYGSHKLWQSTGHETTNGISQSKIVLVGFDAVYSKSHSSKENVLLWHATPSLQDLVYGLVTIQLHE